MTTSYRPVPLHHYVYLGESFNYDKIDDDLLKEDNRRLCNRFIPLYKNKTFYRNCNRFINNLVDKRSKRNQSQDGNRKSELVTFISRIKKE